MDLWVFGEGFGGSAPLHKCPCASPLPQTTVLSSPGGCQLPPPPAAPQGPSQPHCSLGDAESLSSCRDTISQPRVSRGLGIGDAKEEV